MIKMNDVVAIHGGHAVIGSRGARCYLDEVKRDRVLARLVTKELKMRGYNAVNISVKTGTTANIVLRKLKKRSQKNNASHNISIHLNAGGGNGAEIYPPKTYNGSACRQFLNDFCKMTGFTNRGIKNPGWWYVNRQLADCYLIEVGFVDSLIDKKIYKKCGNKYIAEALAECLCSTILKID